MQGCAADQEETQFFDSNLIKNRTTRDIIGTNSRQNFEPDLSMTVPRPYEANLGSKNTIFDFSEFAKIVLVEILFRSGRDQIPAGRGS